MTALKKFDAHGTFNDNGFFRLLAIYSPGPGIVEKRNLQQLILTVKFQPDSLIHQ